VESLLTFADELERRDAGLARALAAVEGQQTEVEEVRTRAAAVAAFLDRFPTELAHLEADAKRKADERTRAEAALQETDTDDALAVAAAGAAVRVAFEREEAAREAAVQLARDAELHRTGAERLVARATELAPKVRGVAAPQGGLAGTLEWASHARGALLLQHAALAADREEIVREASELAAGVLGEPLAAVGAEGLRERLSRARPTL
jgi:septal ring factor EnvC (AmiA/AmiB activator)